MIHEPADINDPCCDECLTWATGEARKMIPKQALEAAKEAMREVTPPPGVSKAEWLTEHGEFALIAGAIAAAAPHIFAPLVADLDRWAGRNKPGYYDEAQDDVAQILNPYRTKP